MQGNLAGIYGALGQHQQALTLKQETLALQKRILPADHPDIAVSMNNLACTYLTLGQHQQALTLLQETLVLQRRILLADHPDIANCMNGIRMCQSFLDSSSEGLVLRSGAKKPKKPRNRHAGAADVTQEAVIAAERALAELMVDLDLEERKQTGSTSKQKLRR